MFIHEVENSTSETNANGDDDDENDDDDHDGHDDDENRDYGDENDEDDDTNEDKIVNFGADKTGESIGAINHTNNETASGIKYEDSIFYNKTKEPKYVIDQTISEIKNFQGSKTNETYSAKDQNYKETSFEIDNEESISYKKTKEPNYVIDQTSYRIKNLQGSKTDETYSANDQNYKETSFEIDNEESISYKKTKEPNYVIDQTSYRIKNLQGSKTDETYSANDQNYKETSFEIDNEESILYNKTKEPKDVIDQTISGIKNLQESETDETIRAIHQSYIETGAGIRHSGSDTNTKTEESDRSHHSTNDKINDGIDNEGSIIDNKTDIAINHIFVDTANDLMDEAWIDNHTDRKPSTDKNHFNNIHEINETLELNETAHTIRTRQEYFFYSAIGVFLVILRILRTNYVFFMNLF